MRIRLKSLCVVTLVLLAALLGGCNGKNWGAAAASDVAAAKGFMFTGYEPVDPEPAQWFEGYDSKSGKYVRKAWDSLANSTLVLENLPDQTSTTVYRKFNANGTMQYVGSTGNVAGDVFEIIIDYAKFHTENVDDSSVQGAGTAEALQSVRMGIGIRVRAMVTVLDASAKLNGLVPLAASAEVGTITGTICAMNIGIDTGRPDSQLPTVLKLDVANVTAILESITAIKAKMYEKGVKLTPKVLAVKMKGAPPLEITREKEQERRGLLKRLSSGGMGGGT